MSSGKLAAQAGHAFTGALWQGLYLQKELIYTYCEDAPGVKIVLSIEGEQQLRDLAARVPESVPSSLVTDSGHVLLPHFDGSSVVTALGIGPCTRETAKSIGLGKLQLV